MQIIFYVVAALSFIRVGKKLLLRRWILGKEDEARDSQVNGARRTFCPLLKNSRVGYPRTAFSEHTS